MALVSIIDTSIKLPGAFIQVSLGVGVRSPGAVPFRILLTGNKTSAGSAAAAELKLVSGPDDAASYWGAGSELHLMAIAVFKANPAATVYGIAIAEAGTAATKDIVFGAGAATAAGTVEVWVRGERVIASVAVGDTVTVIGEAVEAAINARTDLPVTANNVAGTVTLTAKNTGPRGNRISVRSKMTGATAVTHTPVTGYMAGGATYDSPQTALDSVASQRFHLIVAPYYTSTELAIYKSHVSTQAQPLNGHRQRFIACSPDTLANSITLAAAINEKRGQIAWLEDPDDTPAMTAAGYAGAVAAKLSADRAAPLDGLVVSGLKAQYDLADVPLRTEMISALNNGLTPLNTVDGEIVNVRSITSYHKNSSGNPDYSVLDTHYVDVPDFIGDDIEGNFSSVFSGFKLGKDGPDGVPPAAKIATPNSVRDFIFSRLLAYDNVLIIDVVALKSSIVVEEDPAANGRLNGDVPAKPIPHFHQLAINVAGQAS